MKKSLLIILYCSLLQALFGQEEALLTPLEKNQYRTVTSHAELLSYLNLLLSKSKRFTLDSIGRSVDGRLIPLIHVKPTVSKNIIKVLLFCQQHGNEPSGKEAALDILKKIASDNSNTLYPNLDLYLIPSSNPDGNEAGKRANANGKDLNRDHVLLSQPETQAIHSAFSRIQPEVTLDVHEFSAFRKEFLTAGFVRAVDEQFGAPTNLNVPLSIRDFGLQRLFPFLDAELSKQNIGFSNYLKMDSPEDTVRASTTSIDDGRQSFAILNTFSFILEGKNGRSFHDDLKRRTDRQSAAIDAFLRFVDQNAGEILSLVISERKKIKTTKDSVMLTMDYKHSGQTIALPMNILATGADTLVPMKYSPDVQVFYSVARPKAYLIPQNQTVLLELLRRHGISMEKIKTAVVKKVECYTITDVRPVWMENKPFFAISVRKEKRSMNAQPGDVVVFLSQAASSMLSIALEPESMWGIAQSDSFESIRGLNSVYPVYRIMQ